MSKRVAHQLEVLFYPADTPYTQVCLECKASSARNFFLLLFVLDSLKKKKEKKLSSFPVTSLGFRYFKTNDGKNSCGSKSNVGH